eukprot:CAMPEP_0181108724 /NCGR_PEP_ID=MMETSP1071-20121207/17786_1 /TAXON_ID=35127 /ORGANISM="Thalassiosira sp., Strain NH16" /LENGTH=73 /DNA_ID=CAMNT_0023192353 /DNA_START=481 /DNA_END=698 /DNA_ORIENTATION=+
MKSRSQITFLYQYVLNEKVRREEQVRIRVEFFREINLPPAVVAVDVEGAPAADASPPPVEEHGPLPRIVRCGG